MRVVRTRLAAAFLVAFLVFTNAGLSLANPMSQTDEALAVAAALHFRAGFGLSTDLSHVTSLVQDPAANRKYSVALSADEVAELDRRMVIQNALEPLVDYARLFPDTFGGLHVDQEAGGVIYFGFTAGLAERSQAIQAMAPPGADIRFVPVERAETELDELVTVILGDQAHQASLEIRVHDVGTNIPENRVEIFVEPYSSEIAAALEQRYEQDVHILPGTAPKVTACASRDNCHPPVRAGVSNDWGCSVGFGVVEDGYRRLLTAGHCVKQVVTRYGWNGWEWFHHTQSLGLSADHSWYYDSKADAGTMGRSGLSTTVHSNNVLRTVEPVASYDITSQQGAASDYNGYMVCQSGQYSGFRCGKILSTNRSPTYEDGTRMINQRLADYAVGVGDSGGAVISSSTRSMAVGLQSGMDGPNLAYYSQISLVEAALFLQISFSE